MDHQYALLRWGFSKYSNPVCVCSFTCLKYLKTVMFAEL